MATIISSIVSAHTMVGNPQDRVTGLHAESTSHAANPNVAPTKAKHNDIKIFFFIFCY
jgi:hypothetical protein